MHCSFTSPRSTESPYSPHRAATPGTKTDNNSEITSLQKKVAELAAEINHLSGEVTQMSVLQKTYSSLQKTANQLRFHPATSSSFSKELNTEIAPVITNHPNSSSTTILPESHQEENNLKEMAEKSPKVFLRHADRSINKLRKTIHKQMTNLRNEGGVMDRGMHESIMLLPKEQNNELLEKVRALQSIEDVLYRVTNALTAVESGTEEIAKEAAAVVINYLCAQDQSTSASQAVEELRTAMEFVKSSTVQIPAAPPSSPIAHGRDNSASAVKEEKSSDFERFIAQIKQGVSLRPVQRSAPSSTEPVEDGTLLSVIRRAMVQLRHSINEDSSGSESDTGADGWISD